MSAYEIKRDIEEFEDTVKKLSFCVNSASVIWNDAKFLELSASVRSIANMSRDIIITGEHCRDSLARFEAIAAEKI